MKLRKALKKLPWVALFCLVAPLNPVGAISALTGCTQRDAEYKARVRQRNAELRGKEPKK